MATMATMATIWPLSMARVVSHAILCSCTLALTRGGLQLGARLGHPGASAVLHFLCSVLMLKVVSIG